MKKLIKKFKKNNKKILILSLLYFTVGLIFIFGFTFSVHNIIVNQFKNIESQEMEIEVSRFDSNHRDLIDGYRRLLIDYSRWDDSFEFMENPNQQYLDDNYIREYIEENLGVNYVAITDLTGTPLFVTNFFEDGENIDLDKLNLSNHDDLDIMIQQFDDTGKVSYYLERNEGLFLFEINEITRSDVSTNPVANGYMFFGILIDGEKLNDLSSLNGVSSISIENQLPENAYEHPDFNTMKHYHLKNKETISIYFERSLLDSSNNKYYKIDWERTTYLAGLSTANFVQILGTTILLLILTTSYIFMYYRNRSRQEISDLLKERKAMFNEHDAIMLLIDPETGVIIDCNPSAVSFYGYKREELLTKTICDINLLTKKEIVGYMKNALLNEKNYFTFKHRLQNGNIRDVDVYSSPVPYRDEDKSMLYSIIYDVTEREKTKNELEFFNVHDALTGLHNRRHYEEQLAYLEKNQIYPLTLIMADINGLKLVNDTFGHQAGDELLKKSADLFLSAFPDEADICRIGGDEFIILTTKKQVEAEKLVVNAKLRAKEISVKNIQLSISFGIATRENEKTKIVDLFKIAEDEMYQAKLIEVPSMHHAQMDRIMSTLSEKDPYVKEHVNNVSMLCERIAVSMNMLQSNINAVKTAGLLHDIGKIIIPIDILIKPGKLTDEEYKIVKNHSEIGYRILNASSNTLSISELVLYHHERWDGNGYPKGLSKDDIPLLSRIISVADAFDAMTSYRSYSKTKTKKEALNELIRYKGTQFDPDVVDVFEKHFDEITRAK